MGTVESRGITAACEVSVGLATHPGGGGAICGPALGARAMVASPAGVFGEPSGVPHPLRPSSRDAAVREVGKIKIVALGFTLLGRGFDSLCDASPLWRLPGHSVASATSTYQPRRDAKPTGSLQRGRRAGSGCRSVVTRDNPSSSWDRPGDEKTSGQGNGVIAYDSVETTARVVILGAGYAGLIATNRFLGSLTDEERGRVELTVVNPRAGFVERIRLHELAAGSRESVSTPLGHVLHEQATIVVGHANHIDNRGRSVHVMTAEGELDLPYDHLVYAVGSRAAAAIPGAREHAFLLADLEGASAAAAEIATSRSRGDFVVVGGGFTGVEAASELAEQHPDAQVTLFCAGALVANMRPAARRRIQKALRRLGVRIVERAQVVEIRGGVLRLHGGERHAFDVCLVAAAFDIPELAAVSCLPVDRIGRLEVDETLRCVADPAIIGAGDAIVAPASVAAHLRMGCAAALPLGGHAAETLLASIRGTTPAPLSMGYVIQCISLGRKNGYIQVVRPDDTPRRLHMRGRAGAAIKEKICTMVVEAPTMERTKPGVYSWPNGPRRGAAG